MNGLGEEARLLPALDRLIAPRSVAIVGASNDPARIGGRPLARLLKHGFDGPIYPVNPRRESVQGVPALKRVLDLPTGVDCAIIAVQAEEAISAISDAIARGIGSVVLFSAGFAEAGERGQQMQAELASMARRHGVRIVGPNCMGIFNVERHAYLSFAGWVPGELDPRFNIAIVSQSGGYGSHVLRLCERRRIGISHWMTTGNECDVEAGELIQACAESARVNAIFVYLEGVRSKASLLAGLARARERRIPVIVVKSGSTAIGAAAAASHTASLAGADEIYQAVFREYGVFRADSTEEAMDVIYALSRGVVPPAPRTAVFTLSGGVGVQIADYMAENGLHLPELSVPVQEAIRAMAPGAATRNPIDITAQFLNDERLVEGSLDLVLGRDNFNVVLSFLAGVGLIPDVAAPIVKSYGEMARRYPERLNIVALLGTPEVVAALEDAGCIVFEEPRRAVRVLAALHCFSKAHASAEAQVPLTTIPRVADAAEGATRSDGRTQGRLPVLLPGQRFNERQAKELLASCGISSPVERLVHDRRGAVAAAQEAGYPVALKVVSADILHKTDVGGVVLGLRDAAELARAFDKIAASVAMHAPQAVVEGYLVTPMVGPGVECVVGVTRDPVFGPVVMFGIGGILIELVRDVAFRLAPVTRRQALAMIHETLAPKLLAGYRGAPPADIDGLTAAIAALSELAAANAEAIQTLEINPLRVMAAGQGVLALDAVVETIGIDRSNACDNRRLQ